MPYLTQMVPGPSTDRAGRQVEACHFFTFRTNLIFPEPLSGISCWSSSVCAAFTVRTLRTFAGAGRVAGLKPGDGSLPKRVETGSGISSRSSGGVAADLLISISDGLASLSPLCSP